MDQFVVFTDKKGVTLLPFPKYFHLDWEKKEARWLRRDEFSKKEKKSFLFSKQVNWKDFNSTITVCTNYVKTPYRIYIDNKYRNVSFLKSHLQKCIRRSNHCKAIKTAYHMISLNANEFLRRLSIIAIEDVLPLKGYSILMWLVSAVSNGYMMSDSQVCWLLDYVYQLCECKRFEIPKTLDKWSLSKKRVSVLNPDQFSLLYSIQFRRSYGSLKGDIKMLTYCLKLWYTRFIELHDDSTSKVKNKIQFFKIKNRFITPPTDNLELQEWILAAIDFHCYPNMIMNLNEKFDHFSYKQIKDAIWFCSSSKTDKLDINDEKISNKEHLPVWNKIKKEFYSLSQFYLSVRY